MPNPKLPELVLSDDEASALRGWTRRRKTAQALALRARIVLVCAGSEATNKQVAAELRVYRPRLC
jgi:cephalosporin hydroxylase